MIKHTNDELSLILGVKKYLNLLNLFLKKNRYIYTGNIIFNNTDVDLMYLYMESRVVHLIIQIDKYDRRTIKKTLPVFKSLLYRNTDFSYRGFGRHRIMILQTKFIHVLTY